MKPLFLASLTLSLGLGCSSSSSPVESVPQTDTIKSALLTASVDVVRDEWGIPHIYGANLADVAFAQGYVMASDRLVQMELGRHAAEGTLSELAGDLSPSLLDTDVAMRAHHLQKTAEQTFTELSASSDAIDKMLVTVLGKYAAGVNAFLDDLKARAHGYQLPPALTFVYDPSTAKPWTEIDSLALGLLQAFSLSFDAGSEINRSLLDQAAQARFGLPGDPRRGIERDLQILAPIDPTYTISGWTGMGGDTSTASLGSRSRPRADRRFQALLEADLKGVRGIGNDHLADSTRGSNNWIIGPPLSQSGHTLVANDTHLGLGNPSTFYLQHLVAGGAEPVDVMGVQFPGVPGIILGMNRHVAWGATVNNIDVTDVYRETVVPCDGAPTQPCVMFNAAKVPLTPRSESFGIGRFGRISRTLTLTLWDVPHHGPILPRVLNHESLDPLQASELSVRWTGHEKAQLFRGVYGVNIAKSMRDAVRALDRDFKYGGQNWVIGDDQGNFGWTQIIRVPRRSACCAPWKILPGNGSAEWGLDMDPRYIPHSYNPAAGFLATANNDPIGVTDDGDPFFDEPVVDGSPLYLGAEYDPGTRVGRITKRIQAMTAGQKLSLDDMGSIQADAVNEAAQLLQPTLLDAGRALAAEIAQAGSRPSLSEMVRAASPQVRAQVQAAVDLVAGWSFDTPSGTDEESPTANQVKDSQATTIFNVWVTRFADGALGDEIRALGGRSPGTGGLVKLIIRMCTHPELLATAISPVTGDPILFDDLTTQPIESKQQIAAQALLAALEYLTQGAPDAVRNQPRVGADPQTWRWGKLHTLTLTFPFPVDSLNIGPFVRHGDNGTVDVGNHGLALKDFSYGSGPAIRFSCELDPRSGPKARNALPGGETLDPESPHYRDQMELWRKNMTFPLAFQDGDVVASARKEYATNRIGRIRFQPR